MLMLLFVIVVVIAVCSYLPNKIKMKNEKPQNTWFNIILLINSCYNKCFYLFFNLFI